MINLLSFLGKLINFLVYCYGIYTAYQVSFNLGLLAFLVPPLGTIVALLQSMGLHNVILKLAEFLQ